MKRNSERGVALVITLIMLALVTFMAVVFLGISRREKASVTVVEDLANSRLMADAARARAVSELISRMMTSSNAYDYDLIVSTNYQNPLGFRSKATPDPYNVSYFYGNGTPLRSGPPGSQQFNDWLRNIANLQYDARPPVFIGTNLTGLRTNDFRYYLDLNRNGLFDPTGPMASEAAGRPGFLTNYYVGDPQWIGVLANPDLPHGESNQFVGRYAFLVVPSGKALDLNYVYNNAKRIKTDLSQDGFYRHQGVGPWEINLPGFFATLNTNVGFWPLGSYNFDSRPGFANSGAAFDDARLILRHRYDGNMSTLASAQQLFGSGPLALNTFQNSGIDYYADNVVFTPPAQYNTKPWSGSYNPDGYYDIQELFDPTKSSPHLTNALLNPALVSIDTPANAYNNYTYYRLLSQLGTDSGISVSNKLYGPDYQLHYTNRLHLNYINLLPNEQTNFIPWTLNSATRTAFFTNAADRILRANLDTIVLTNSARRLQTNFMMGLTPVRNTFSLTNIQLRHLYAGTAANVPFDATNNEYTATTYRCLQLAANIHDALSVNNLGTVNDYPSVFRPVFTRTITNLVISGYVEETNTLFLNFPWMTIEQAAATLPLNRPIYTVNLFDVGPIIGAKKGYPNFNKLVVQTVADVSRKLEIRKAFPGGPPVVTNQMYLLGVSNRVAVEGWNSYQSNFNRNLELRATNYVTFALHHWLEGQSKELRPITNFLAVGSLTNFNNWPGSVTLGSQNTFVVPVETNMASMVSSIYRAQDGTVTNFSGLDLFEHSFHVPQWTVVLTNRMQYILIDHSAKGAPRIIDFVNLDKLVTTIDLGRGLRGNTNAGSALPGKQNPAQPASLGAGDMWNAQHEVPKNLNSPSLGVLNQISVAEGTPYVGDGTWRKADGQMLGPNDDKRAAIQEFKTFLAGGLTNLAMQVPFSPSRKLYQKSSWEANDPLVHYKAADLADLATNTSTNSVPLPLEGTDLANNKYLLDQSFIRKVGQRYRPWGGSPNKQAANDTTAYAVTMKDPLIRRSDDWQFPTNKFPNIGMLGRVHRGTPWQTVYLKAGVDPLTRQPLDLQSWANWSGSFGTHPTNDWRLLDLFTVAPSDNASRGLLSVNQTNLASWAAVLSGVTVVTNALPDAAIGPSRPPQFNPVLIQPNSPQMLYMVDGINRAHAQQPNRTFSTLGQFLAAPELTVLSPFLKVTAKQVQSGLDDAAYEKIPQQVLSLLRTDEPRITVYAFGQSLKPADRAFVTTPQFYNLCTNYQVTGEFATKTVLRLEELPPETISNNPLIPPARKMRAVVESFSILQPN